MNKLPKGQTKINSNPNDLFEPRLNKMNKTNNENISLDNKDIFPEVPLSTNKELIDPDEIKTSELSGIIENHIQNSIRLFNLYNKVNNKNKSNNEFQLNISKSNDGNDKLNENYTMLKIINDKIDNYIFYHSIFAGISIITLGVVYVIKN